MGEAVRPSSVEHWPLVHCPLTVGVQQASAAGEVAVTFVRFVGSEARTSARSVAEERD